VRCVNEFYQFGIGPKLQYNSDGALLDRMGDLRAGVQNNFGSVTAFLQTHVGRLNKDISLYNKNDGAL